MILDIRWKYVQQLCQPCKLNLFTSSMYPEPISYARTNTRNVKREPGHVLYSAGTVTTVLSKAAGMENEVELWEVEVGGATSLEVLAFFKQQLFTGACFIIRQ